MALTPVKAFYDTLPGARSHLTSADLRPTLPTTGTAASAPIHCNERLRETLLALGCSPADLAARLGVDPKTVERWIGNANRTPYPRTAYQAARILDVDVTYLWPTIHNNRVSKIEGTDELSACWPGRATVPADLWGRLLIDAQRRIIIMGDLALSDLVPNLPGLLLDKADQGVRLRVILSDPDAIANPIDRIRAIEAEAVYLPLAGHGISVSRYPGRLATTILRVDDDLIVRTGIDGCPTAFAPVMHLRALPNGPLSRLYLTSIDSVIETAVPVTPAPAMQAVA
ncbi:helix-turn-helix transcriptional regulator [Verrucosispora sp. WMMD1129]|uniref:helix-turn-helix domain-containing protein n=1 Tax=Verrucosispora sp. WMMD1129 TaxID=3016093 RepID=UPI00249B94EA|nr:helix-turn-helix transcriptional regulator [Verrucosispora sp. WMMD1129]WFE45615.1 helix-turn-helix transcriptional regulator [Verrucosispora sp. WMMD1129]